MAVTAKERPVRPDRARVAQLDALADLHAAWVDGAADGAGFSPEGRKAGSDYNLHHVDLDAAPDTLERFRTDAAKLFESAGTTAEDDDPQQQAWVTAVAAVLAGWPALSAPMVEALATAVAGADAATLAGLGVPQQTVSDIAAGLTLAVGEVAADAATAEVARAQEQGVAVEPPVPAPDQLAAVATVTAALIAAAYVAAAIRRALQVGPATAADAVRDALTGMGTARSGVVVDHVKAAMSAAQNVGRYAVFAAHPPKSFRSSEHRDKAACKPCRDINGHTYPTLAAALVDYPGNGGYAHCAGGLRCRGHVVAVWT